MKCKDMPNLKISVDHKARAHVTDGQPMGTTGPSAPVGRANQIPAPPTSQWQAGN